jgi:beta-glucanase (GH16 family)
MTRLVLLILAACVLSAQPKPVWSDEFDQPGLPDPAKWAYDVGGDGWGNQELQFYTANRMANAEVKDGKLIIRARKEEYEGRQYTSARLVTKGKAEWTYGWYEVRAKLPKGRGTWPAIWMLGVNWSYGNWPAIGEIDIMEHVGYDQGKVHGTIHCKAYNHVAGTQKSGSVVVADVSEEFHVYALNWTKNAIEIHIDGKKYFTFGNEGRGSDSWPFDKPFYLLLNVAVGGGWGGLMGVDDSVFPQAMEVDYVRVYAERPCSNSRPGAVAGLRRLNSSASSDNCTGLTR